MREGRRKGGRERINEQLRTRKVMKRSKLTTVTLHPSLTIPVAIW